MTGIRPRGCSVAKLSRPRQPPRDRRVAVAGVVHSCRQLPARWRGQGPEARRRDWHGTPSAGRTPGAGGPASTGWWPRGPWPRPPFPAGLFLTPRGLPWPIAAGTRGPGWLWSRHPRPGRGEPAPGPRHWADPAAEADWSFGSKDFWPDRRPGQAPHRRPEARWRAKPTAVSRTPGRPETPATTTSPRVR